jgi:hypothetical protein
MTNQQPPSVAKWTLYTFIGWFTGIVFMLALASFLDSIGIEKFQFFIGVGLGAGVGFFPMVVIEKKSWHPSLLDLEFRVRLGHSISYFRFNFAVR